MESSNKSITMTTDLLNEITLHDLIASEANESVPCSSADKNSFQGFKISRQSSENGISPVNDSYVELLNKSHVNNSSEEDKQREIEKIISSATSSWEWEYVFPPQEPAKNIVEKNISNEHLLKNETSQRDKTETSSDFADSNNIHNQKSPFKSSFCFIDAASLVDEEDDKDQTVTNTRAETVSSDALPPRSPPFHCSTAKFDVSRNEWSESNDKEDFLEHTNPKYTDSVLQQLSHTIFKMSPEDSLLLEKCLNDETEPEEESNYLTFDKESLLPLKSILVSNTPHNSIMSFENSALKQYESEESESDALVVSQDSISDIKKSGMNYEVSSPNISDGASIVDQLPQMASCPGTPLSKRNIENMPIVSGAAYILPEVEKNQRKSPKPTNISAWIVDMAQSSNSDVEKQTSTITNSHINRPGYRTCEILKTSSKLRLNSCHSLENNKIQSSSNSDGSEKSNHNFFIDLSSLPDKISPKNNDDEKAFKKKNIFSMYIDLGEKPAKEMPTRLISSLTARKNNTGTKDASKCSKSENNSSLLSVTDVNFESYESLCNNPNISISEIIRHSSIIKPDTKKLPVTDTPKKLQHRQDNIVTENRQHSNPKSSTKEKSLREQLNNPLVKLSDLDKPVLRAETPSNNIKEKTLDVRMTRSIPENTWAEQGTSESSRPLDIISSFHSENTLSLNRLFPHLKNELSRNITGSLSSRARFSTKMGASSGDLEKQGSEISEISSMQSSLCGSVVDNSTTADTSPTSSLIASCQSCLGQDLLRMFLQEIAPDVIVEVAGRRIKAHKCILSSRCQYFAGILGGGWVESAGNVIVLPPFSYNVVHFALCHIYSGLYTIPDSISIVELATLADMLGLEGLKEAIMHNLKVKYCHNFHRPCQVCMAGVFECFPLTAVYGLDDLYHKCLKWITKYFSKVWPTKAFATLPKELLDKCYQQHIVNLSIDNLFDTVFGCGIIVSSLPNSRWADSVARMCQRLVNAAAHFACARLAGVLRAAALLPADAPPPAHTALNDCMAATIEWAQPDEACRSYAYLSAVIKEMRSHHTKPDLISSGNINKCGAQVSLLHSHASNWHLQCEGALVRNAPQVVICQAFQELPPELQKRLRGLGCIMYGATSTPIFSSNQNKSTYTKKALHNTHAYNTHSLGLDIDHVRASFVPYSAKPIINPNKPIVNNDVNNVLPDRRIKGSIPPKIRTTKAQEERARYNLSKNNKSQDRLSTKLGPARIPYENTKPRYLEPKIPKEIDRKTGVVRNIVPKMISSSESSRNSSPIQAGKARSRLESEVRGARAPAAASDNMAGGGSRPRTADPPPEPHNKYATYTKLKHADRLALNSIKYPNKGPNNANHKTNTKIPVYSRNAKSVTSSSANSLPARGTCAGTERKASGSLMTATKSSLAKIVPKVSKEANPDNSKNKKSKTNNPSEISVIERSGTFLKEEPTFADKTANIDINPR